MRHTRPAVERVLSPKRRKGVRLTAAVRTVARGALLRVESAAKLRIRRLARQRHGVALLLRLRTPGRRPAREPGNISDDGDHRLAVIRGRPSVHAIEKAFCDPVL